MKILSLFDGMACGALAMQSAGIEIDKYAIQTAQHNFPFIDERGNKYIIDNDDNDGNEQLVFDF